jgi:hypothetical protein
VTASGVALPRNAATEQSPALFDPFLRDNPVPAAPLRRDNPSRTESLRSG